MDTSFRNQAKPSKISYTRGKSIGARILRLSIDPKFVSLLQHQIVEAEQHGPATSEQITASAQQY